MEAKQKEFLKYIGGMVLFVCFVWKYELVFRMVGWVYRMISPLIYGFVIAFILNLLVRKIEKCMTGRMWQNQTVKRCISIILSVVIAVGVITAVLAGLIPEIVNSAKVLQEKLPAVLQNVAAWMEENFHMSGNILDEMQKFKFDPAMLDDILQNDTLTNLTESYHKELLEAIEKEREKTNHENWWECDWKNHIRLCRIYHRTGVCFLRSGAERRAGKQDKTSVV